MADNVPITPGAGIDVAADEIGGVKHQRMKMQVGADGVAADVQPPDADAKASASILPAGGMVWNGTNWDRVSSARDALASGALAAAKMIHDNGSAAFRPARVALRVPDGTDGLYHDAETPMLYNNTTFDRERGNTEGTLLASAARTASGVSANQTNHNARGVIVTVSVTAKAATTTLDLFLQAVNPVTAVSVVFVKNLAWAAPVGGSLALICYPGVLNADLGSTGSNTAVGKSAALPRTWIAEVAPSDANSVTYSVAYQLIL